MAFIYITVNALIGGVLENIIIVSYFIKSFYFLCVFTYLWYMVLNYTGIRQKKILFLVIIYNFY